MRKWNIAKRIFTMGILVATIGLSTVGCGSNEENKHTETGKNTSVEETTEDLKVVRISGPGVDSNGTVTLPGAAQLAQRQGFFEEELKAVGYKVEYSGFQNGGVGVNEALASGETDIAVYGDFPAVTYISNGNDAKIFAISTSKNQLGIYANNDIQSVKDLKGKKVGTMIGTNAYYYLEKELEENGLSLEDVEIVNAATDVISLFSSGEIDAICNGPQLYWLLDAQKAGHVISISGDSDTLSTSHVVLGRTQFLEENPEVIGAIVKALERTKEWAEANEEAVYETLANLSGGNYSVDNYKDYYSFEDGFADMTPYIQDKDIEHLQTIADFMLKNQYIKSEVDVSKSIDDSIQAQ